MKKKLFAANWKLHKTPQETKNFFQSFSSVMKGYQNQFSNQMAETEVLICPPALCFGTASESLASESSALTNLEVNLGLQNVYCEPKGAFTGENSGDVAKAMGAKYILVGHSERRTLFHEANDLLNKKIKYLNSIHLKPVYCIGETLEQRDQGQTNSVLKKQIIEGLNGIAATADFSKNLVIAYEPVWAIGTGRVANVQQVAEAHSYIYQVLKELGFSDQVRIQYGGSVKPENAKELIQIPHVDGFLVGGASLEVESFAKIIFN